MNSSCRSCQRHQSSLKPSALQDLVLVHSTSSVCPGSTHTFALRRHRLSRSASAALSRLTKPEARKEFRSSRSTRLNASHQRDNDQWRPSPATLPAAHA